MTGSWRLELNGTILKEGEGEFGKILEGHAQHGHMEGISVPYVIDKLIERLHTGDKLLLVCELEE